MRTRIAVIWGLATAAIASLVGFFAYGAGASSSAGGRVVDGAMYHGYYGFGFFPFFGLFWLLLIGLLLFGLFRRPWGRGPWGYGPGRGPWGYGPGNAFRDWHQQAHAEGQGGAAGDAPAAGGPASPTGGPIKP